MEGTPGAGKTTWLGSLLAGHTDALIFPEAQPPPDAQHPRDLEVLLAEDHHRTRCAASTQARFPNAVVASDRCHLGVLAYRYALAATGRAPWAVFEQAHQLAQHLDLDARHQNDEVHISLLDPEQSCRRRAAFARDRRYQTWFDPEFLTAYNHFLSHLDRWVTPGPRWTFTPAPTSAGPWPPTSALRCSYGCTQARSPLVTLGESTLQLHTGALHRRASPYAPVSCLRTAGEIAAAWHRAASPPAPHRTPQPSRPGPGAHS